MTFNIRYLNYCKLTAVIYNNMVFIKEFDEFLRNAQNMFEADPVHTRCVIKYRHANQRAILKVTNNVKCEFSILN